MGKHLPGVLGRLQRWSYLRGRTCRKAWPPDGTYMRGYMRGYIWGCLDTLEALRMKLREEAERDGEA